MNKFELPKVLKMNLKKYTDLRYGENPHQKSAFYIGESTPGYEQLWGIELSHNNLGDANHAWRLVSEFKDPTVAIIKHGNPSGITSMGNLAGAFKLAYKADNVSAFGGIVAVNRPPTMEMIEAMRGIFFELLVAPDFSKEVLERLKKRSAKMRVIKAEKPPKQLEFTRVFNGYLVQTPDVILESRERWKVVAGRKPSSTVFDDLEFAWKVVKHVRSNAIVVVREKSMVGMGTGQPNRVNAVRLALLQAKKNARGAILASDAFFPFEDNVLTAAKAGIKVILQPGGSIHDDDVITAAKKHNMTMVFTGVRHFKH
ncbi:MAG: bifunctional phosphoribosylaminoimidazolecarboxamide formyltransferase/IMP cyclohydrolase [Candidatus Curtissbacteria bacterium]|nr:bifunctional phosphoribosylaminoimidazolecarboxamide formyltransferase/IMP cyclohydrolase [Candidatus Curtissbacteria bacterium]